MSTTLHAPDEPIAQATGWRERVIAGESLSSVIGGADGITDWAWHRWRAIESDGVSRDDLDAVLQRSARELWLWLVGERTWSQAIGTVLGRLSRRL
jgi:hypothetical protein